MIIKKRLPALYILNKVKYQIFYITVYSIIIYFLKQFMNVKHLSIPIAIPSILGTTISLLLAFKTNQSYDRWWEARILWGSIVNESRNFIRQIVSFCKISTADKNLIALIKKVSYRQIAWSYLLVSSLREQELPKNLSTFIDDNELSKVKSSINKPNALLQFHSLDIQTLLDQGIINNHQMQQLDNTINNLCNSMGGCERIKATVFPPIYSVFINSFVYLFALSLPLGLIDGFGISEIPITAITVTPFFIIEKIAVDTQNPFENKPTDTPISAISRNIEINIRQMIGETEIPEKIQPDDSYLM